MGARKKPKINRCSECGAELRQGPARCPLCGAEPGSDRWGPPSTDDGVEDYQHNVRDLREELRKLRQDDAEAV